MTNTLVFEAEFSLASIVVRMTAVGLELIYVLAKKYYWMAVKMRSESLIVV